MKLLLKIVIYTTIGIFLLLCTVYFVAWRYKDEIMAAVKEEFNSRIHGELIVKDMDYDLLADFPNFSFTLVEAAIKDSLFPIHQQYLFKADKVHLQLSLLRIVRGEIYIKSVILENANINLFKDKNKYSNLSVFRSESIKKESASTSPPGMELTLKKVALKNVAFSYVDSSTSKTIRFLFVNASTQKQETDSSSIFQVNGLVNFDRLTFNPKKGSFLKNKAADISLFLGYEPEKKQLYVYPSGIRVDDEYYQVEGDLIFGKPASLALVFTAEEAILTKVLPLLTQNIAGKLRKFTIDRPVSAIAKISTQLLPGYIPEIDITFKTNNASVTYKGQTFTNVTMTGKYVTQIDSTKPHGSDNEAVVVSRFFGRYEKIPFKATYTVTNLKDPNINIKANSNFLLTEANHLLDETKMTLDSGSANMAFTYKGKLAGVFDMTNDALPGKLNGTLIIKDVVFQYLPRQFKFSQVNSKLTFNQSDIDIKYLDLSLNTNAMHAKGKMSDFFPVMIYNKGKLYADVAMNMPSFNFDDFKSPGSLQQMGLIKKTKSKQAKRLLARNVESVIDKLECRLVFKSNTVRFRKFNASDVKGNIILADNSVQLQQVSLNSSGGNFALDGKIEDISLPVGRLEVNSTIQQADVRKLFYSFDNFRQKTLEDKHLMGKLNAHINFSTTFDQAYNIQSENMKGKMHVELKDGRLINFEPLEKISKVAFKKRDFTDIEFADIINDFELDGQNLKISRMEVASSILTFFVQGVFSFKDATDLSVQIPLTNLRKREKDYIPENIGVNQDAGTSIYLRAKAPTGAEKVKITLDPFKKGVKEIQSKDNI